MSHYFAGAKQCDKILFMKNLLRKNSNPYQILKYLLMSGGIIIAGSFIPGFAANLVQNLIKFYLKDKKFRKQRFMQDIKRLQDRKLLTYQQLPDGKIKITLTNLGKQKVLTYDINKIKLSHKN
jgi:hypothetical protein